MTISKHFDSYPDLIDHLKKKKDSVDRTKPRQLNLLLGNGFSVNYSSSIFTYKALAEHVKKNGSELVKNLFSSLKTENFELIMEQLDQMIAVLSSINSLKTAAQELTEAKEGLKTALLDAIRASHPEHVFKVTELEIKNCAKFLRDYINANGKIFTTNYDLLLYWVINRGLNDYEKPNDGFSKFITNPQEVIKGEVPEYSDLIWTSKQPQNVFNLHGGLHIFDEGGKIIKETYNQLEGGLLLDRINSRLDSGNYPIFVTDGNGDKKLKHIRRNRYLSNAYESLREIQGSLIVFGFSFSENDFHIIDAINQAAGITSTGKKIPGKLLSVYIGVYDENAKNYINSISDRFAVKVNTFDSSNAGIWH